MSRIPFLYVKDDKFIVVFGEWSWHKEGETLVPVLDSEGTRLEFDTLSDAMAKMKELWNSVTCSQLTAGY